MEVHAGHMTTATCVYDPVTGRFESIDRVFGGNDNPYVYPGDPINAFDLNCEWGYTPCWHGHCQHGDPHADAGQFWDTLSLGLGAGGLIGCELCAAGAGAINGYQFFDSLGHGDRSGAAFAAVGFIPAGGRFASWVVKARYVSRLRSSYTKAGRALKYQRTSIRAQIRNWEHRSHSMGRVLERGALSVEAFRYGGRYR